MNDFAALAARIEKILAQPEASRAFWGIEIRALADGQPLFARNPDKLFTPASNTKLFTTAAALALHARPAAPPDPILGLGFPDVWHEETTRGRRAAITVSSCSLTRAAPRADHPTSRRPTSVTTPSAARGASRIRRPAPPWTTPCAATA